MSEKDVLNQLECSIRHYQTAMMRKNQQLINEARHFDTNFDLNHRYSDIANQKMISNRMDTVNFLFPTMEEMLVNRGRIEAYQDAYNLLQEDIKENKKQKKNKK